jgi:hypothetical protein
MRLRASAPLVHSKILSPLHASECKIPHAAAECNLTGVLSHARTQYKPYSPTVIHAVRAPSHLPAAFRETFEPTTFRETLIGSPAIRDRVSAPLHRAGSFHWKERRGVVLRAGLEDHSDLVEAAQQTGEHVGSAIEGGAENFEKSAEAVLGAAAAAGAFAGQFGKVVGKATSLVRDAYGPQVEDEITESEESAPTEVLGQVKEVAGAIKAGVLDALQEEGPSGESRLDALKAGIDGISDEVKLAASQAGLTAVAAAAAALKKETGKPSATELVEQPTTSTAGERKRAEEDKMSSNGAVASHKGATEEKPTGTSQSTSADPVLNDLAEKKGTQKVESLVASHLKQEVSDTRLAPGADAPKQESNGEGPAVVVVDALKERLADFAGGVEEEIKKEQAERAAEKEEKRGESKRTPKAEAQKKRDDNEKDARGKGSWGGLSRQQGATRVRVGRERHIPVNKADLIPAMRELFRDPEEAAGFVAVCTSVESILHAEHQVGRIWCLWKEAEGVVTAILLLVIGGRAARSRIATRDSVKIQHN